MAECLCSPGPSAPGALLRAGATCVYQGTPRSPLCGTPRVSIDRYNYAICYPLRGAYILRAHA
eukprot:148430-Prymnesium_polylepis.1